MAPSALPSFEGLLSEASERITRYEWMAAAELYQQALAKLNPDQNTFQCARVTELLAKSHFKVAFQSKSREEFKEKMRLAQVAYENATSLYERAASPALSKRSKARALFAEFWFNQDPAQRREIIGLCRALAEDAAEILERQNGRSDLAETHKDLLAYLQEEYFLAQEWTTLKDLFEKAVRIGDDAISEFERLSDDEGLLETLYVAVFFLAYVGMWVLEPPISEDLVRKIQTLTTRLGEVSEKIGRPHALSLANQAAGRVAGRVQGEDPKALRLFEAALETAKATSDSYLIGTVLADTVDHAYWAVFREEYVEAQREILEGALGYASTAIKNLEISSHSAWLGNAYGYYAECYIQLAVAVETEGDKKREYLRKAIEISSKGTTYEDHLWWWYPGNALSKAMYSLATIDQDPQEKQRLLRESLPVIERTVRFYELLSPHSFRLGFMRSHLGLVKGELSNMERDPEKKSQLLKESVSDMKKSLEQCLKRPNRPDHMIIIAGIYDSYGDFLLSQNRLTGDTDVAREGIKAYENAIGYLTKAERVGPIATLRWKAAKVYDGLSDYRGASRTFRKAAEDYRLGGMKVPGLASAFGELASYMEAWAIIEDARLHHGEEQYPLAAQSYSSAADILRQTRSFGYLSRHYEACSFLESGEGLSRQDRQEEAKEAFSKATKAFEEAKADLENKLREELGSHQERELKDWLVITESRGRYCLGRIELEEASILDRKGEKRASSAKYRSSSETFKTLLAELPSGEDRGEVNTLILSCDAWAKMKEAEAKASPELYAEAVELFRKAKETSTRERFGLLVLANSFICKALEAGTRFRLTRDTQLYSTIKKHLETSADYYKEGGFRNAANWARATQRLFDALVYLTDAEVERDAKKKAELYHLGEKHLQLSAKLYGEAGFAGKRDEAVEHLERVREEKELLLTPIEALSGNPVASGVSVTPVSLTRDQALGLERFEEANLVGNLTVARKEIDVGSELMVEFEIANVGKTAATLVKLEHTVPEGFEVDREKTLGRVQNGFIDLKGKRLEYFKTHEIKVSIKALRKGAFQLRPRILYVDEKGNYRSYDFEPATVSVKELGISGWVKGR